VASCLFEARLSPPWALVGRPRRGRHVSVARRFLRTKRTCLQTFNRAISRCDDHDNSDSSRARRRVTRVN